MKQAAGDPARVAAGDKPVKGKIDGTAGAKVGEVVRCPDARLLRSPDAALNGGLDTWRGSRHGHLL